MIPKTDQPKDIIKLDIVIYDQRARGTWCRTPYLNHPRGCPNFPACLLYRPDFKDIPDIYIWYAIIERFDLKAHAESMKKKIPSWTDRQCRNPIYWQGGVRKRLREKAKNFGCNILLDIPEACGVEVFETMKQVGVNIEKRDPEMVIKVMLAGRVRGCTFTQDCLCKAGDK